MRKPVWMLICAAALSLIGATSPAAADYDGDNDVDDTRIYGGLWLGFGGDAEFDENNVETDLGGTLGGQFGVDVLTSRYFSLGGEARIGAAKFQDTGDRSKVIDLDFKPRLRLPLYRLPIELYAALPVGLTIPRLADFANDNELDGKVGWNIGAAVGANWFITRSFGLNVEPAWLMHRFKVDGANNDFTLKQFALFINAVIAL